MKVTLDEALHLAKQNNYYYLIVFMSKGEIYDAIGIRALFPRLIRFVNDYIEFAKNLGEEIEVRIYYVPTGKQIGLSETTLTLAPDFDQDKPISNNYM